jgi:hypothetical protein
MADHVTIDWQNKSHQELDCSCRLPHQVITRREYYKRQVVNVYPLSVHDLSNEEDASLLQTLSRLFHGSTNIF